MNKLIKSAAFISIGGLAVVGAIALFQEFGPLHLHHDEPIIIDNGPAYWKLLPPGHDKEFKDLDPNSSTNDGGKAWAITDKKQFNYLKILLNGSTTCTAGLCFYLEPSYPVSFVMKDEKQNAVGTLRVEWVKIYDKRGTVALVPDDLNGYNLRWKKNSGTFKWHQLRAKTSAKKYSISHVVYRMKGAAQDGGWTRTTEQSVKVLLCVVDPTNPSIGKCTDPEP